MGTKKPANYSGNLKNSKFWIKDINLSREWGIISITIIVEIQRISIFLLGKERFMVTGEKITVVIADDDPYFRDMIGCLLRHRSDFSIVGEAENGIEAIQMVRELSPDLFLLDIHMPIFDGIETLQILRKTDEQTCIIMLSAFENEFFLYEAMTKCANGYLMKDDNPKLLVDSIKNCVMNNQLIVSPQIFQHKYTERFPAFALQ
jgi:CheY-like chemotaxis protein